MLAAMVGASTEGFIEHYGEHISPDDTAVLQAFAPQCGAWLRGRSERFAPVHGDYRLDNLLFGKRTAAGVEVAAVDWQTLDIGLPGRDLAYFLGNSLLVEDRRSHECDLVRAYFDALIRYGVTGYTFEECFDDYRYGQFQGLMITVLAAVGLTHTERGDAMFMAMSSRACAAIRDLGSLELL
jgi:aminoglycoside phosphotransferase (APT) family kinase protein